MGNLHTAGNTQLGLTLSSRSSQVSSSSQVMEDVLMTLAPSSRSATRPATLSLSPSSATAEQDSAEVSCQLFEGLFEVRLDQDGKPQCHFCWPPSLHGSRLQTAVVDDGFCLGPNVFGGSAPSGFGSMPFVFTLLETTIDSEGDPNGVLYGCVCAGSSFGVSCTPTPVLCLVSRVPVFGLLFAILGTVRDSPCDTGNLLSRLQPLGASLISQDVHLLTEVVEEECHFEDWKFSLPWPPIRSSTPLSRLGPHDQAQWQVWWGLSQLLADLPDFVGDALARLLVAALLEQKVLLLGNISAASAAALALRGFLPPFRWLHPFLSSPPPAPLLKIPLLEATMPLMLTLPELPPDWGYKTLYELPPDVVTGLLSHAYVHVNTSGQISTPPLRFPAGRQLLLMRRVSAAKRQLHKGGAQLEDVVKIIQEAFEEEVVHLADVIRRYVADHNRQSGPVETLQPASAQGTRRRAMTDCGTFLKWLHNQPGMGGEESVRFYSAFFQTQLCMDLLHSEMDIYGF